MGVGLGVEIPRRAFFVPTQAVGIVRSFELRLQSGLASRLAVTVKSYKDVLL